MSAAFCGNDAIGLHKGCRHERNAGFVNPCIERSAAGGTVVRGRQGFMKLNMELDVVNRSTDGRPVSVVARSFGAVGAGFIDGTPSTFSRKPAHMADGRDLISINISCGGRFRVEGVHGLDHYEQHGA